MLALTNDYATEAPSFIPRCKELDEVPKNSSNIIAFRLQGLLMATAAAGRLPAVTPPTVITDDQRRWVVIGICLNKLLTPLLRNVLAKEILGWYNQLCLLSSKQINIQIYKKHIKTLPSSTIKLNYGNINKNYDNHKLTYNAYDYNVKDPESTAKLFVQPFMGKFSGFNQTMDLGYCINKI